VKTSSSSQTQVNISKRVTKSPPPNRNPVELARIPRSPLIAQRLATHDARKLALACLLAGGDDYELCFTAPPSARERVAAIARELSLPLTRIGVVTSSPGLHVRDEHGVALASLPAAFDHFR